MLKTDPASGVHYSLNKTIYLRSYKKSMMIKSRCAWCGEDPLYVSYHDKEWGVPVYSDDKLFEFGSM